jgi:hypothetical protein
VLELVATALVTPPTACRAIRDEVAVVGRRSHVQLTTLYTAEEQTLFTRWHIHIPLSRELNFPVRIEVVVYLLNFDSNGNGGGGYWRPCALCNKIPHTHRRVTQGAEGPEGA